MSRVPTPGVFPIPLAWRMSLRRWGGRPTPRLLLVSVCQQRLWECERQGPGRIHLRRRFIISTSRFGVGQQEGSFQTPLGLHRVARKIGAGEPIGTVFKARRPVGLTRNGLPDATICHRILWLEGLEPGLNSGGTVDSFRRYIYIHGFGDETTLGRPASHGCIHLAASDLIPLFDRTPEGTLVWIDQ
jgi:hypothetical protein